jgi:hypothetical protein
LANAKHGISGFPPNDIKADYLSIEAQRFFNATSPNTWTTANGLWRFETPTGCVPPPAATCLSEECSSARPPPLLHV